jgi:hypothetical protein
MLRCLSGDRCTGFGSLARLSSLRGGDARMETGPWLAIEDQSIVRHRYEAAMRAWRLVIAAFRVV